ncbi:hypothetical protein Tco_1575127 [Tanacetum coccineum]
MWEGSGELVYYSIATDFNPLLKKKRNTNRLKEQTLTPSVLVGENFVGTESDDKGKETLDVDKETWNKTLRGRHSGTGFVFKGQWVAFGVDQFPVRDKSLTDGEDGKGGGHLVFLVGGRITRNSIDRQRYGCQVKKGLEKQHGANIMVLGIAGRGRGSMRGRDGNEQSNRRRCVKNEREGSVKAGGFGFCSFSGLKKTVKAVARFLDRVNRTLGQVEVLKAYSIFDRNVCVIDRRRGKDERKEIKAGGFEFGSCCGQEGAGETTRCEHYGVGSSNRDDFGRGRGRGRGSVRSRDGNERVQRDAIALGTSLDEDVRGCDVMITEDGKGGGHLVFLFGGRITRNSIDRQRYGCQVKKGLEKQHGANIMALEVQTEMTLGMAGEEVVGKSSSNNFGCEKWPLQQHVSVMILTHVCSASWEVLKLRQVRDVISCTNEGKPLALLWGRTPRLDSGVRWPEWDLFRTRIRVNRDCGREFPSVGDMREA